MNCPVCREECDGLYTLDCPKARDMCNECIKYFYEKHIPKEVELFACPCCDNPVYEWKVKEDENNKCGSRLLVNTLTWT